MKRLWEHIRVDKGFNLAAVFTGRLAVGDPAHVPAGFYARQALVNLGWWPAFKDRIAPAPDVRAALAYVERGECAAGRHQGAPRARSRRRRRRQPRACRSHQPRLHAQTRDSDRPFGSTPHNHPRS